MEAPIFEVRKMFEKQNPKIQLSNEAAAVLNDALVQHFTSIASKAVQIIKKAAKDNISATEVREIIAKVTKNY